MMVAGCVPTLEIGFFFLFLLSLGAGFSSIALTATEAYFLPVKDDLRWWVDSTGWLAMVFMMP